MRKLKIKVDANDRLLIELKEEIHIFHKFVDLLISIIIIIIIIIAENSFYEIL